MVGFTDDVERQLAAFVKNAEVETAEILRKVAMNTFDQIQGSRALWSGYYKSNHRIQVRNSKGQLKPGSGGAVELFPSTKPDFPEPLIYVENVEPARTKELRKLSKLEVGDTVRISTNVPYADEVERKYGVYRDAEATLKAQT